MLTEESFVCEDDAALLGEAYAPFPSTQVYSYFGRQAVDTFLDTDHALWPTTPFPRQQWSRSSDIEPDAFAALKDRLRRSRQTCGHADAPEPHEVAARQEAPLKCKRASRR